jgi:hypothetical protein
LPRWSDSELHAMEHDPDYWDWDSAEEHPGLPTAELEIVVRLTGAEAKAILSAARSVGMKSPDFLREAALEKARTAASVGS